jgi:hypothetical protein
MERQSHAAQGREAAIHRRAYRSSRKAKREATVSHRSDLQLTGGRDSFTREVIHPPRAGVLAATARITAGSRRWRDLSDAGVLIWSRYCTMESCIQIAWQTNLEPSFLSISYGNIPESLQQSCSPIDPLYLCYSDPSRIPTGFSSNLITISITTTGDHISVSKPTDSPTWRLFFS